MTGSSRQADADVAVVEAPSGDTLILSDALHAHLADNITLFYGVINTPLGRVFVIRAEGRVYFVAKETRVYAVMAEARLESLH